MSKILEVKDMQTVFYTERGVLPAVDKISFDLEEGKTLGIVGESGCGKSMTALSIMGLVPKPAGRTRFGEVNFEGKNLLKLEEEEMRKVRGKDISMIFQEPMTSLNPVYTVGNQLSEVFELHFGCEPAEALERSIEALKLVGIPSPEKRILDYPHSMSGGMRQRVMIAMALACRPKILICDEPTTALDVTIQAQILDLMKKLQEELGMAMIFITHDLGVIADLSDEMLVMYAGKVVERAETKELFKNPEHPYTEALLKSIPRLGQSNEEDLFTISGIVPELANLPKGCYFADRCQFKESKCEGSIPSLTGKKRQVRCYYPRGNA